MKIYATTESAVYQQVWSESAYLEAEEVSGDGYPTNDAHCLWYDADESELIAEARRDVAREGAQNTHARAIGRLVLTGFGAS